MGGERNFIQVIGNIVYSIINFYVNKNQKEMYTNVASELLQLESKELAEAIVPTAYQVPHSVDIRMR